MFVWESWRTIIVWAQHQRDTFLIVTVKKLNSLSQAPELQMYDLQMGILKKM